jgi:protein subunit release factor A
MIYRWPYCAVRVTHIPTGTVAEANKGHSQYRMREWCFRILRAKLTAFPDGKTPAGLVRTYDFTADRVTDERTGASVDDVQGFLDGDMDRVRRARSVE